MQVSKCPTEHMLLAFVQGELDPESEDKVAQHSSDCVACDSKLAAFEQRSNRRSGVVGTSKVAEDFIHEEAFQKAVIRVRDIGRGLPDTNAFEPTIAHKPDGALRDQIHEDNASSDRSRLSRPSIRRYRILRDHAEGGLGKVSIANDEELNREVALKEIKPVYADDPNCRQRFASEAEITGNLEHPGIVPVYGFGEMPDGRMYYAMRFIHGDSMKDRIQAFHENGDSGKFQSETFRKLIGHFMAMCYAVAYANSRRVLHRDLKPANVMLGDYGETLVVDWGLAKPQEGEPSTTSMSSDLPRILPRSGSNATRTGSVMGTVGYMSPEQAQGQMESLRATSDVFSLGATLYHLLVGAAPFTGKDAIERAKRAEFISPRQKSSAIPKPLEGICLRAMHAEPDDRYSNAKELARDIERWLNDEAVAAYRESRAEQFARWTRKNFRHVISVGISLVLLVVVLTVATVMVRRSERRAITFKREAVERAGQTRQVVDVFLGATSDLLEYYPSAQQVRVKLLERAARDYEVLAANGSSDPELEVERGRVLLTLGKIYLRLNNIEKAEAAFTKSESVFASLVPDNPSNLAIQRGLADSWIHLASVQWDEGQQQTALEFLRRAAERLESLDRQLEGEDPAKNPTLNSLGIAYMNRGELLDAIGNVDDARQSLQKAQAVFTHLTALASVDPRHRERLANVYRLHGRTASNLGELKAAQEHFTAALRELSELVRQSPNEPFYVESHAGALIESAGVYRRLGLYEQERDAYETAKLYYDQLLVALPNSPILGEANAITLVDLARMEHQQGNCARAEELLYEALLFLEVVPDKSFSQWEQLGAAKDFLAQVLADAGDADLAEENYQQALKIFDVLVELPNSPRLPEHRLRQAISQRNLAELFEYTGRKQLAVARMNASIQSFEELTEQFPERPSYRAELAITLARAAPVFEAAEQPEIADRYRQQSIAIWRDVLRQSPEPDYSYLAAKLLIDMSTTGAGDPAQAVEWAKDAVQAAPANSFYLTVLGAAHFRNGEIVQALECLTAIPNEAHHGEAGFWLAIVLAGVGRSGEAREAWQQAQTWRDKNMLGNHRLASLQAEAEQRLADEKAAP